MEQKWFEMTEIRKRRFDSAVWIPLRASEKDETGKWGHFGHKSEFFGAASLAVPLRKREAAASLGWSDLNLMHDHRGYANRGRYISADEYDDKQLKGAVPLVMSQSGNSAEPPTWHIHPDFVITLKLKREGNVWVAMDEDYIEVVRLKLDEDNRPRLLEVRAEHLKDYLCARRMALRISWYRERREVVEAEPAFNWPKPDGTYKDGERWEGRIHAIHEGGELFGESMAVLHVTRTNLDFDEDVPRIGISDDTATSSFTRKLSEKRKLYRVAGEVWRAEWVEPGARSTRIRGDEPHPPISFVVDAAGKKQIAKSLIDSGRWLWFKPEVIPVMFLTRGNPSVRFRTYCSPPTASTSWFLRSASCSVLKSIAVPASSSCHIRANSRRCASSEKSAASSGAVWKMALLSSRIAPRIARSQSADAGTPSCSR
jgi:hypothetical protein